jgi:hypothetical protein
MIDEIFYECDICKSRCKTKYILNQHKKRSKTCMALQGSKSDIECDFCLKTLSSRDSLNNHLQICKEKNKAELTKEKKENEKKLIKQKQEHDKDRKELVEKLEKQKQEQKEDLEKQRQEHKDDLEKQKHEYEEKLEKQKQEYEEKLEKEREVIRKMAMKSTTTNKTTVNNMNTLNFNDTERLNQVIHNNINEQVVEQGQVGIAGVIYHKFLKDENGKQLYVLMDGARQNFRFVDPKGNVITDVGAKILTDAIASSNLEREMANIAKDMKGLHDNKERFENVMSLSSEFKTDNSTFRKEIVHLAKKEQKGKV